MEVESGLTAPDGPKIFPYPNSTSYDGWYWDVVSTSSVNESIIIASSLGISTGSPFESPSFPITGSVSGTFSNGTAFSYDLSADPDANVAVVTSGDTTFGNFRSEGFWWKSNPNIGIYVVVLDVPSHGISGTITLNSIAPVHYPCGVNKPNSTEIVAPGMGWVNNIPDAHGVVEVIIGSEKLSFTGNGYEDKIWGDTPLLDNVKSWYWGHGHFGPYSVVWYDLLDSDGTEHVSSYATYNGILISGSCESGAVKARPYGGNDTYPPQPMLSNPEGFTVDFDLGSKGLLEANVTIALEVVNSRVYARYVGGIQGGEQFSGKALFEQFRYG